VKSRPQVKLVFVPEREGFWIGLESKKKYSYRLDYVAIGSAGHQITGTVTGFSGHNDGWIFVSTRFRLLTAALTSVVLVESQRKVPIARSALFKAHPTPSGVSRLYPSSRSAPFQSGQSRPGRIDLLPSPSGRSSRVTGGSGYGGYGAYSYAYGYGYAGGGASRTRALKPKRRKKRKGRTKAPRRKQ
jgi:hypothetical protein